MQYTTNLKKIIFFILLVTPVILGSGILFFHQSLFAEIIQPFLKNQPPYTLDDHAENIYQRCQSETYRPSCYDLEIPKLMDFLSLEDAFRVTAIVQDKDPSYQYCHVLGHNLSAREVQKKPEEWKNVVARCPSGRCSNGCVHGGFQERFRAETLSDDELEKVKRDLLDLCEPRGNWIPTGLEQGTCYHALGHLTMYLTNASIHKATALCNELTLKDSRDWRQLCFDGAFMQIFQPLEPEDFALVAGKQPSKNELIKFCDKFSAKEKSSCWNEGWPLFREEVMKPDGLARFCAQSPEANRCYESLFYVLTVQFQFDLEKMKNFCTEIPRAQKGRCFANVASRLIETDYRNIDRAINFCNASLIADPKGECFNELIKYSTYNFHKGSEEYFKLCGGLPNPWQAMCLEKN